jgi:hypothetical protein
MKTFMFQMSAGYSGRLKAKNKRRAKKYLQETYPESVIYLLINEDSKYIKSLFRRKCG